MKTFLYLAGWISLVLALVTLAEANSSIHQGVAAMLWVAAFVALGAGAICGRLDRLTPKEKSTPPAGKVDEWDRKTAELAAAARAERLPANTDSGGTARP